MFGSTCLLRWRFLKSFSKRTFLCPQNRTIDRGPLQSWVKWHSSWVHIQDSRDEPRLIPPLSMSGLSIQKARIYSSGQRPSHDYELKDVDLGSHEKTVCLAANFNMPDDLDACLMVSTDAFWLTSTHTIQHFCSSAKL